MSLKIRSQILSALTLLIAFSFVSCDSKTSDGSAPASRNGEKLFNLREDTGIEFSNDLSPTAELNILTYLYYYDGGGVASGDLNNDGLIDLYFTGNQVADHLYLNQGDLTFKEITLEAGIENSSGWTTGVTMVDINSDGLLDIYVCKIGKYKDIQGANRLFINQGVNESGIPEFKDEAASYGLDIQTFSTQAAFFDYDLDHDLDMFLLNHSVNPNRTYGKGNLRTKPDSLAGDRLLRNDGGKFVDVSVEAGIFQGKIGYGLGLGVSDLNNDGYPDIYIGNDFFENDYVYLNTGKGTFRELITADETTLGHTTHASMGNDLADYNNDGWIDIISLDMLPQELKAYKMSGQEYSNQIYNQYLKNGYRPQYTQNTLHLNDGGNHFKETAYAAGIAATDWSWSPLLADLDNDGFKDVFICNGILGATNDMDFISFISNEKIQSRIDKGMEEQDLELTKDLPERKLPNHFFRNRGDLTFEDVTSTWYEEIPSFSNGSSYADLDNDGDLDLIVNNVNSRAYILENKTNALSGNHHLKVDFEGPFQNKSGIGARVEVHADSAVLAYENFLTRGYLSSVAPELTIGLGTRERLDSIVVRWPGGRVETRKDITAGENLVFRFEDAQTKSTSVEAVRNFLTTTDSAFEWKHREPDSYEFGREPLIPYSKGSEGPGMAVGDANGDGLQDIYLGGGKRQAGVLYLQQSSGAWIQDAQSEFALHAESEETAALFFDADGDQDLDLVTASGGNEAKQGPRLRPILYLNHGGRFKTAANFPELAINASDIVAEDLDGDGDMDLIISSNARPQQFARGSRQIVLFNSGSGKFEDVSESFGADLQEIGLIEDLEVCDLNSDSRPDLVVAGHWSPITLFYNDGKKLVKQQNQGLDKSNGLWNAIKVIDIDQDGDLDLVAGNWGLNTRLRATSSQPLQVYLKDFDNNGREEAIVTLHHDGVETVFSSKTDLVKQLPMLNKKFLSYQAFAEATVSELFGADNLNTADRKVVYTLEHSIFLNDGENGFNRLNLPHEAQLTSAKILYLHDFDKDGLPDILMAGNDFNINTQLGRLDAGHGLVLLNRGKGSFVKSFLYRPEIKGQARSISELVMGDEHSLVIGRNNDSPVVLKSNITHE